MHALPPMVVALCVVAIAYRYYSGFIAAKVLVLDDTRVTPAHRLADGQNYVPTNRWVLFGHHFAAITGAGPLVGPVLAAQFGFLPGYLWILVGVVLAGAVHDFVVLTASVRHDGKSLAEIVRVQLGPRAGFVAICAVLFIVTIAIAAMAKVVVASLSESAWGAFTIAATVPIALLMSLYMYRLRPGKIGEASVMGVLLLLVAVAVGKPLAESSYGAWFLLTDKPLTLWIAAYGFVASVLPVWLLLCPRDYLSSYLKLGTIALLVVGIVVVNPELKVPMLSQYTSGGPVVAGSVFPFVFITIACGAISGFHGLIGSGTTPKMLATESDARFIGYGAMLCEGLVGIVALIAASSLDFGDYLAINTAPDVFAKLGIPMHDLERLATQIGEKLVGKTGGAVTLAVGMSQIFAALPGLESLISYWYHFAIMFEALFILTTVDTGTRVARFLVQEFLGRAHPKLGRTDWLPGTVLSTSLVVLAWGYLVWTGNIRTIWPIFGIANQLLACIALVTGTTILFASGRGRHAWVTLLPLTVVTTATQAAGATLLLNTFIPVIRTGTDGARVFDAWVLSAICVTAMAAMLFILAEAVPRWIRAARTPPRDVALEAPAG